MTSAGWIAVGAVVTVVSGPLVASQAVGGDGRGTPISLSLRSMFERAAGHMLRVAELAAAALYEYRPSPESRSLGEHSRQL